MQGAPEDRAGRKKGAHYTAHMRSIRILGLLAFLLPCALAIAGRHSTHAHSPTDARRARAQLEAVRDQIARVALQVSRGQAQRDLLTRQLRDTEKSVGA